MSLVCDLVIVPDCMDLLTGRMFVTALRKHSTEVYYLNGGVAMDLPGRYNIAGTSFDYKYSGNDGYSGPEKLKALGPTSFALDVMVGMITNVKILNPCSTLDLRNSYGTRHWIMVFDTAMLYPEGNSALHTLGTTDQLWPDVLQHVVEVIKICGFYPAVVSVHFLGPGHFYRPVNCINVHTGTVVDDRHCTHESKPTVTYLPCNNRPCPAR